uniref:SCAN box domain-containing protein n=1 Tax=Latimeria chalumnae TaxID=7897 RepID=H3A608_LATCH
QPTMEEMLREMVQATRALQEANRAQWEAALVQQESNRLQERTNQILEAQQETNQILLNQTTQSQAEIQELRLKLSQMGKEDDSARPIRASLVLQKMTPEDDVEAYLLAFERCAEREGWRKEQRADIVAPFFMGDAQKAYFDLEPEAAADYFLLKAEILARVGVTPTVRAQRFHTWSYQAGKAPKPQMFDLIHLARWWLQPDINSPARIVELVVMDRYLRALPLEIQKWVGQGNPANAQELIALVERQVAAEELVKTTTTTTVTQRSPGHPLGLKAVSGCEGTAGHGWGRSSGSKDNVNVKRFGRLLRCHRAIQCPLNDEPTHCDLGEYTRYQSIKISGKEIDALIDSGSVVTLVSATLIKPSQLNHMQKRGITCVHGDINYYPTTLVKVEVQGNTYEVKVGIVPKLPHLDIIGRD